MPTIAVTDIFKQCHLDLLLKDILGAMGDMSESAGTLWRFAPMADPQVAEWHSRDLDSRIMSRETAAVRDWKQHT